METATKEIIALVEAETGKTLSEQLKRAIELRIQMACLDDKLEVNNNYTQFLKNGK